MENLPNSFLKKLNFQTVVLAIIFMSMNGHKYKLFKPRTKRR